MDGWNTKIFKIGLTTSRWGPLIYWNLQLISGLHKSLINYFKYWFQFSRRKWWLWKVDFLVYCFGGWTVYPSEVPRFPTLLGSTLKSPAISEPGVATSPPGYDLFCQCIMTLENAVHVVEMTPWNQCLASSAHQQQQQPVSFYAKTRSRNVARVRRRRSYKAQTEPVKTMSIVWMSL